MTNLPAGIRDNFMPMEFVMTSTSCGLVRDVDSSDLAVGFHVEIVMLVISANVFLNENFILSLSDFKMANDGNRSWNDVVLQLMRGLGQFAFEWFFFKLPYRMLSVQNGAGGPSLSHDECQRSVECNFCWRRKPMKLKCRRPDPVGARVWKCQNIARY